MGKLTFEYVLLSGVNDTDADARRVVRLLGQPELQGELIALNPGPGIPFETPEPERVASFQRSSDGPCPASFASRAGAISTRPADS